MWKKEAPFLYDFIILHSVNWPSMTFQWLPDTDADEDNTYHYALISSNATDAEQCQVQKIRVALPNEGKSIYVETQAIATCLTRDKKSPLWRRYNTMVRSIESGIALITPS